MVTPTTSMGTLTLMGSGELGTSMSKVHRAVASRVAGAVRPVFVNTPAGFEPNVHDISANAAAYIEKHLGVACEIASHTGAATTPGELEHALAAIGAANYIFAGPGSPSYAVRHWSGSPILELMARRLREGGHIVCASAAAIALGAHALPVYEIFKAGDDPHWIDGLDLLGPEGLRLTIVPHWNNAEGGAWDSRFCFMGEKRFAQMEALLPADAVVLGIDERTACTIDLAKGEVTVMGAGGITVRRGGEQREFAAGSSCPVEELRAGAAPRPPQSVAERVDREDARERLVREAGRAREHAGNGASAATGTIALALASAIEEGAGAGVEDAAIAEGRAALVDYLRSWEHELTDDAGATGEVAPFIDLLVEVRTKLRDERNFALSDAIRDGLTSMGIAIEDAPDKTSWRRER